MLCMMLCTAGIFGGVDWPCMGKPFCERKFVILKVYIESLSLEDYHIILKSICPDIPSDVLRPLILFNEKVHIIIVSTYFNLFLYFVLLFRCQRYAPEYPAVFGNLI